MRVDTYTLEVAARVDVARDIIALDLVAPDRSPLPLWEAGAHLELFLPGQDGQDIVRHYSLCGDPDDKETYRVAVLRVQDGRGGSAWVHENLVSGATVRVRGPHNHFPLTAAPEYAFIAGGIGITPILAMARWAQQARRPWRAVYLGRDRGRLAFVEELLALGAGRDSRSRPTVVWSDAEQGTFDLAAFTAELPRGAHVYACGPEGMLTALESLHGASANWDLHLERFATTPVDDSTDGAFEVVASSSGESYAVPSGCSILSVLRDAGLPVEFSCAEGVCGTCETGVLEGIPEHRDAVLTAEERELNDSMMICVSRAKTARLVLDL